MPRAVSNTGSWHFVCPVHGAMPGAVRRRFDMPHRVLSTDHSSGRATSIRHASPGTEHRPFVGLCDVDSSPFTGCPPGRFTGSVESDSTCLTECQPGRFTGPCDVGSTSIRHATPGRCNHRITKASGSRPTIDSKCSPCPGGSGWQVPNHRRPAPCLSAESGYANIYSWCRATTRRGRVRCSYRTI